MKNIFKRVASLLTSAAMACTFLAGNFTALPESAKAADSIPTFEVKSVVVDEGATTASFDIYLNDNAESGFATAEAWLALPDGYTFKSATAGEILTSDYASSIATTFKYSLFSNI